MRCKKFTFFTVTIFFPFVENSEMLACSCFDKIYRHSRIIFVDTIIRCLVTWTRSKTFYYTNTKNTRTEKMFVKFLLHGCSLYSKNNSFCLIPRACWCFRLFQNDGEEEEIKRLILREWVRERPYEVSKTGFSCICWIFFLLRLCASKLSETPLYIHFFI